MIVLSPPGDGRAPLKRITLHSSGTTIFPDFKNGGRVKVDEEEARELEAEGWRRDTASRQAKAAASDLLRKGMNCQLRRMTQTDSPTLGKSGTPSDSELLTRGLAAQLQREPHSIGSADLHERTEFGTVETPCMISPHCAAAIPRSRSG